ncbi:MAG: DUF3108 domain-containing protein [Steroidobacteraceae bacterium]|jgi:hypothetical protein|nr:DUF3108 domain-containing protein [Steroidobacteraceae bacterium]
MRTGPALAAYLLSFASLSAAAATPALAPFVADYAVSYGSMNVGTSRFELKPGAGPGRWIFESRSDAQGLARLIASGRLVQTSWLTVDGAEVRPQRFRFDDGASRKKEDANLAFDWQAGRVTGDAKGQPVDLAVAPGTQDPVSSQLAMMVALLAGREPANLPMIDGGQLRETEVKFERRERVTTPAGEFETLVYTSRRPGGRRVTWMWLTPSLQYLPVRMEQVRDGKRAFHMQLTRYEAAD